MAGTITQKLQSWGSAREGTTMMHYILTCTGDASNGSFPATALGLKRALRGCRLEAMETHPGPTAPTALYDITITDDGGFDMLGGAGADRSATVTERVVPVVANGIVGTTQVSGVVTLNITNNSVNSAVIVIDLWFSR